MADVTTRPNEPHHQLVVTAVLVVLVAIPPYAQERVLLQKKSLVVNDVVAEPDDLPIEARLLTPEDFPPFAINIDHVAEDAVPLRMFGIGGAHFGQNAGPQAIIRVENDDQFARCHARALFHGMIMALVVFRDPGQPRGALEDFKRAVR